MPTDQAGKNSLGDHFHLHLLDGRARNAQIYPPELCRQILLGIKDQLTADGLHNDDKDLLNFIDKNEDNDTDAYISTYIDDLSGTMLEP